MANEDDDSVYALAQGFEIEVKDEGLLICTVDYHAGKVMLPWNLIEALRRRHALGQAQNKAEQA